MDSTHWVLSKDMHIAPMPILGGVKNLENFGTLLSTWPNYFLGLKIGSNYVVSGDWWVSVLSGQEMLD